VLTPDLAVVAGFVVVVAGFVVAVAGFVVAVAVDIAVAGFVAAVAVADKGLMIEKKCSHYLRGRVPPKEHPYY